MTAVKQATFGAGCFWGAEQYLRTIGGIIDSRVGFASPADELSIQIEVVQVDFDPSIISYDTLLEHFWTLHDPTSKDRQGNDSGVKYRSAVFYHDDHQQQLALASRQALEASARLGKPVVTVVVPLGPFELAAEEQQQYLEKHGGSCSL